MSMEGMYLRAWIDGLHRINNEPPPRPVERPEPPVRVAGPGEDPYVRLRLLRGGRG